MEKIYSGNFTNYSRITIQASSLEFCFNENNSWDNNNGSNYHINSCGVYKLTNGYIESLN